MTNDSLRCYLYSVDTGDKSGTCLNFGGVVEAFAYSLNFAIISLNGFLMKWSGEITTPTTLTT